MLASEAWESAISTLKPEIVRGTERLRSSAVLAALGTPDDFTRVMSKQVAPLMRRLGWRGPKPMRFGDKPALQGYWRPVDRQQDGVDQPGSPSCAKLGRRRGVDDIDLFTVLPTSRPRSIPTGNRGA
jgi:hypothetical protein